MIPSISLRRSDGLWPLTGSALRSRSRRYGPAGSLSLAYVLRHNLPQLALDVRPPRLVGLLCDGQLGHKARRADVAAQNDCGSVLGAPI